ncbi:MAG: hypothetical protein F6K48_23700 [Okeania sp. SIO3H1]|nr:hypothetical protein [Okeania sp. SIO3H1]
MSTVYNFVLYAGPTLALLSEPQLVRERRLKVLPPVQRGDISLLCRSQPPGVIILVDGLFHHALAVSHLEIREAINCGWSVWGISSIGAIRAYEMRNLGMHGFGKVFDLYCQEDDFQDDEVALLHEPIPPYRMFSEPLVHIRVAVAELQKYGLLTLDAGSLIISSMKQMWFGARTFQVFEKELEKIVDYAKLLEIRRIIYPFDRFRVKTADLEQFLRIAPYLNERNSQD